QRKSKPKMVLRHRSLYVCNVSFYCTSLTLVSQISLSCPQNNRWMCPFLSCAQILLEGIEMDPDDNIVLLDKELASMRIGRNFLSLINDNIPKSQSSMMQIVTTLQNQRSRLTPVQFDNLVLSMVYSAKQGWHQKRQEDQEAWGRALLQLANITVHELRGSYLFNYT
uniref:Family with sequence similarity 180 member B n=1 Tax=Mola mola TaxID=94237 RepID=A0A3Q3VTN2_MOLML